MLKPIQLTIFIFYCLDSTLALDFAVRWLREKKPNMPTNMPVFLYNFSSAIWSIGLGLMSVCKNETFTRGFFFLGIMGCFLFMMTIQTTLCMLSGLSKPYQYFFNTISHMGIFIFIYFAFSKVALFKTTLIGQTFYYERSTATSLYALYFIVVCFNIFFTTLYMYFNHKLKRIRMAARKFIFIEILIFIGAIFDMVLPVIQIPAIPGSTITHFWGVLILWYAVHGLYDSQITIKNMSGYIYYNLSTPVLLFDYNYNLVAMNNAAATFFDQSNDEDSLNGLTISSLFTVEEDAFTFDNKSQIISTKSKKTGQNLEIAISKIKDDYNDESGFIAIVTDLTEHEMVISNLEQAKLAADSANMSKSLFLANMSHEIRTPMNAILGFSEIALSEKIDAKAREYFLYIKQAGESLLEIINDILNISKIELGKMELVEDKYSTAQLFKEIDTLTTAEAKKKRLIFDMEIDEHFPSVLLGDKDKLRDILLNLLSNSVKYTKAGRVVLIAKAKVYADENAGLTFIIQDTGIGIKEENLPKIFDKFSRIDASYNSSTEGTGLGLSITKGLIDLFNGNIKVDSTYGMGTTFTVTLAQKVIDHAPVTLITSPKDKEEKPIEPVAMKIPADNNNFKVLAVDDNKVNLKVVSSLLDRYNINHDNASSGAQAISLCQENTYNLILLDHLMPEMDGIECLKHIREIKGYEKGSCPIAVLTANSAGDTKNLLIASGFDYFLTKPIRFSDFEDLLAKFN